MLDEGLELDFETRGVADLMKVGPHRYAEDPFTQVLCFAWQFDDMPQPDLWNRHTPGLRRRRFDGRLVDYIRRGGILKAHNAMFEWCIWNLCLRREHPELPPLSLDQHRCTAAKAAAVALPRALGEVAEVLKLPQRKDADGHRLMLKVSKPRRLRKAEREEYEALGIDPSTVLAWNEEPAEMVRNWSYCKQDVRAEKCLDRAVKDLPPDELALWQMDQRMNDRGMACDVIGVQRAVRLAEAERANIARELQRLTDGAVPKATSRAKFKKWVNDQDLFHLTDTKAATIGRYLDPAVDDRWEKLGVQGKKIRDAMELVRDGGKSSVAKYQQMLDSTCEDGRIKDLTVYCGAARTGRWSGARLQPHNFVRGYTGRAMEQAWECIHEGDPELIRLLFGSVMPFLAKATRGGLVAADGCEIVVADFAAIEARVLLWLAMDYAGIAETFAPGKDPYNKMASDIYGRPVDRKNVPEDKDPGQVGKTAILGLGYAMGWEKFQSEVFEKTGIVISDEFAKGVVRIYRKKSYPMVESLWNDTEKAAIHAAETGEETLVRDASEHGRVRYRRRGRILQAVLPSGRALNYFDATVAVKYIHRFAALSRNKTEAPIIVSADPGVASGRVYQRAREMAALKGKTLIESAPEVFEKKALTFWGRHQKTGKWTLQETHGGTLVENNDQATARDFLAYAMKRTDDHPLYDLLLSIHDEVIAEAPAGEGDVRDFEQLLCVLPPWGQGCPIGAEGWKGLRYRK